jgi:beta-glucosidase
VAPSGKLPVTFPVATDQLPPYEDYSMKGRTYRYMTERPLYPFGFGLSYTNFRFDSITLSANTISAGGSIKAIVTLTNIGQKDADNVVQIYVSKDNLEENDPLSSLRGFRRVFIQAGKSEVVEFELTSAAFESINAHGETILAPGSYSVIAADAAPLAISEDKGASAPVSTKVNVS